MFIASVSFPALHPTTAVKLGMAGGLVNPLASKNCRQQVWLLPACQKKGGCKSGGEEQRRQWHIKTRTKGKKDNK
jgi:hypothetical protein